MTGLLLCVGGMQLAVQEAKTPKPPAGIPAAPDENKPALGGLPAWGHVGCFGFIDMRAQAEVLNARRNDTLTDTPTRLSA